MVFSRPRECRFDVVYPRNSHPLRASGEAQLSMARHRTKVSCGMKKLDGHEPMLEPLRETSPKMVDVE